MVVLGGSFSSLTERCSNRASSVFDIMAEGKKIKMVDAQGEKKINEELL